MSAMSAPQLRPTPSCVAELLLDIELERGTLQFVLACDGAAAHAIRVRFSRVIRDLAGLRVNDNPLYSKLEFLPAGRRIRLLVDTLAGYQQRRQPMQFQVRLEWRGADGVRCRRTINHDLTAWTRLRELL